MGQPQGPGGMQPGMPGQVPGPRPGFAAAPPPRAPRPGVPGTLPGYPGGPPQPGGMQPGAPSMARPLAGFPPQQEQQQPQPHMAAGTPGAPRPNMGLRPPMGAPGMAQPHQQMAAAAGPGGMGMRPPGPPMGPPGMQQPGVQQQGPPVMGPPGMQQPGMQQPGMMGPPGMQQGPPVMGAPGMQQPGMQPPGMGAPPPMGGMRPPGVPGLGAMPAPGMMQGAGYDQSGMVSGAWLLPDVAAWFRIHPRLAMPSSCCHQHARATAFAPCGAPHSRRPLPVQQAALDAFETLSLGPSGPAMMGQQADGGANPAAFPRPAGPGGEAQVGPPLEYSPYNAKPEFVRMSSYAVPNSQVGSWVGGQAGGQGLWDAMGRCCFAAAAAGWAALDGSVLRYTRLHPSCRCAVPLQALKARWHLPFGAVVHPMAEACGPVPVANASGGTIIRCKRCRTYMNPFMSWMDGGRWVCVGVGGGLRAWKACAWVARAWKGERTSPDCQAGCPLLQTTPPPPPPPHETRRYACNVCQLVNEVPVEYFCALDASGRRLDLAERPELSSGSVEYVAPAEYMVRAWLMSGWVGGWAGCLWVAAVGFRPECGG